MALHVEREEHTAGAHALLLTDVVDSTAITERLGEDAASALWSAHDRLARDLIRKWRGREIDKTDGMLILFESVEDAAGYAIEYQRALADRGLGIEARAGIHFGRISLRMNSTEDVASGAKPVEVEGIALPTAARVMSLASGNQILLTEIARARLDRALPGSSTIAAHGHYKLKGIAEPVEIFEIGVPERAPFMAPPDTDKAFRVVRTHDGWLPIREVRHNLPRERDGFVGRVASLAAIAAHLDAGTRLLTVLGSAGTGKTRLVRRYAWNCLGDWPGGVYFCDLSEARTLEGILFVLAVAMEVPLGQIDPSTQLAHAIATRGRCLIILDNFEQIVEYAETSVNRWLNRAPDAAFLVTSRERLRVAGEQMLPLEPLSVDDEGIELFALRARAQRPEFRITSSNRAFVKRIVALLDGLPLAIELAAARIRVMSAAQMLERLQNRFALLSGARASADRQATLRKAIDWSWELLLPSEQAALAQCSVFEGGFTLEAAEAVLDLPAGTDPPAIVDVIQALVDKSLLRTWVPAEQLRHDFEEPYFGMYLSIHEYAAQKLVAAGGDEQRIAEHRHGRYFARLGSDENLRQLYRHGGVARRRALALEIANLLAACHRAVHRTEGEIAVATLRAASEALITQGPFDAVISLGADVDSLQDLGPSLRAAALTAAGQAATAAGRLEQAGKWLVRAAECARIDSDRSREADVLSRLAQLEREQGRMGEARSHAEHALALRASMDTDDGVALAELALVQFLTGAVEDARANYERALAIDRAVGDQHSEVQALTGLANLHAQQDQRDVARALFTEALSLSRESGDRRQEGRILMRSALLDFVDGLMEAGKQKCEAALAIYRDSGDHGEEAKVRCNLSNLEQVRGNLNEAQAQAETALRVAREVGLPSIEARAFLYLGAIAQERRHFEEASRRYQEALTLFRAIDGRRELGLTLIRLTEVQMRQGRPDEARTSIAESEAHLRAVNDRYHLVPMLCTKGQLAVVTGDLDVARSCVAEALGERARGENRNSVALLCLKGQLELADGELERAEGSLQEALGEIARLGSDANRFEEIADLRKAIERVGATSHEARSAQR